MFTEAKSQCVVVLIWHTLGLRECNCWRGQLSGCVPCQFVWVWLPCWVLFWWAIDWVKYRHNCSLPNIGPPRLVLHFSQHLPEAVGFYAAKRVHMFIFMNHCRFLKSSCYSTKWSVINCTPSRPTGVNQNCLYPSKWSSEYKWLFVYFSNQILSLGNEGKWFAYFLILWITFCCCYSYQRGNSVYS